LIVLSHVFCMPSIPHVLCCAVLCFACCSSAGTGGLRLLSPGALSNLLQLLSERDMPVDMLQLLVFMAEDGCR
jgi:hypothetical protein